MKTYLIVILSFLMFLFTIGSCKNHNLRKDRDVYQSFKTEEEHEKYNIKKIFKHKYREETYNKQIGKIINDSTNNCYLFRFDSVTIITFLNDTISVNLFVNGLITPQMLEVKTNKNKTYKVKCEEILYTKAKKQKRRFKLYKWELLHTNPEVFIVELTNNSAKSSTNIIDFIKNSNVSFLYFYGLQI